MLERVKKEYEKLELVTRAGLKSKMKSWVDERQQPETHFKWECRVPMDGKSIAVCVFKDGQARLYGASFMLDGKETFICSEIDPAKKRNKADQEKLKRAAQKLREYLSE